MSWLGEVDLANMDDSGSLVCSFAIVGADYQLECRHVMHNECVDAFLEMSRFTCDTCANSQWFFASGQYEQEWDGDYESGYVEEPLTNTEQVTHISPTPPIILTAVTPRRRVAITPSLPTLSIYLTRALWERMVRRAYCCAQLPRTMPPMRLKDFQRFARVTWPLYRCAVADQAPNSPRAGTWVGRRVSRPYPHLRLGLTCPKI